VIEALSAIVFVWLIWRTVVTPLRRDRRLGIDGMIALGCLFGFGTNGDAIPHLPSYMKP
jgi:hypothetical protein